MTEQKKIFGTDGVRGVANVEPVTAETALKLGRAAAHVFAQMNPRRTPDGARPKIVLGKDTRLSGYMLENALVAGITSLGVDVLVIGPLPTPGVAYITRSLRADAGIVLSASHNAYQDNGIKFFRHDGYKLDDQIEEKIENLVFTGEIDPFGRPRTTLVEPPESMTRWAATWNSRRRVFPRECRSRKCGSVSMSRMAPLTNRRRAYCASSAPKSLVAHNEPNGMNINDGCERLHPTKSSESSRQRRGCRH